MLNSRTKAMLAAVSLAVVGGVLPLTAAAPASAAVSCSYTANSSQSFTFGGFTYKGFEYAGHYSGLTTVPSTSQVTSSGEEAQCLLKLGASEYNEPTWDPGTVDGVFGSHSQAAMDAFQKDMNAWYGAGLKTGPGEDLPGPNSWKWLRWYVDPNSTRS